MDLFSPDRLTAEPIRRRLEHTEDGSMTIYVPALNEHYHSVHGAIQEARHIFIQAGIGFFLDSHSDRNTTRYPLHILEAGFGTGLNAYLTLIYATEMQIPICYHSIEKYPLTTEEITALNYPSQLPLAYEQLFYALHAAAWETEQCLTPYFTFCKHRQDFRTISFPPQFHIVFFDAFNPEVQPHLWTAEVFARFYQALAAEGILVTYCVKGTVKQALRSVGFSVKRLPGPPGKREMLRASRK